MSKINRLDSAELRAARAFKWFDRRRYARTASFTAIDWHEQIARRVGVALVFAPKLVGENNGNLSFKGQAELEWESIKNDPLIWKQKSGDNADLLSSLGWNLRCHGRDVLNSLLGVRSTTFADVAMLIRSFTVSLASMDRKQLLRHAFSPNGNDFRQWMSKPVHAKQIAAQAFGFANVDLDLPNSLLENEFRIWLREARNTWGEQYRQNSSVEPIPWLEELHAKYKRELHWKAWSEKRILELMDLLIASAMSQVGPTAQRLTLCLYGNRIEEKNVRYTRDRVVRPLMMSFGGLSRQYKELQLAAVRELLGG